MTCFTLAKDFICNFAPSCETFSNSVLLTTPITDELPELIDEDNEFIQTQENEDLDVKLGDLFRCVRDGVNEKVHIINMLLEPKRT